MSFCNQREMTRLLWLTNATVGLVMLLCFPSSSWGHVIIKGSQLSLIRKSKILALVLAEKAVFQRLSAQKAQKTHPAVRTMTVEPSLRTDPGYITRGTLAVLPKGHNGVRWICEG